MQSLARLAAPKSILYNLKCKTVFSLTEYRLDLSAESANSRLQVAVIVRSRMREQELLCDPGWTGGKYLTQFHQTAHFQAYISVQDTSNAQVCS